LRGSVAIHPELVWSLELDAHSIEIGGQGRVAVLLEETRDLGPGDAGDGEFGDLLLAKETRPVGVYLGERGLVRGLAQLHELVDVVRHGWVAAPVAVVGREEPDRLHPVP
jgi:hypothetical protein